MEIDESKCAKCGAKDVKFFSDPVLNPEHVSRVFCKACWLARGKELPEAVQ